MFDLKQQAALPRNLNIWLPKLHSLVVQMQMDAIPTVEVLCIAVAGEDLAGLVLYDLLEMMPRSIRTDGAVWQSDKYWKDCRGASYFRMQQVRNKLAPVIEIWKENAQGAPTFHYKVNEDGLVEAVSKVFKRASSYIRVLVIYGFEKGAVQTTENRKSITKNLNLNDSNSSNSNSNSKIVTEVVLALVGEGMTAKAAEEFATQPIEAVRPVIEMVQRYQEAGKIRTSKVAYLLGALRRELKKSEEIQPVDYVSQQSVALPTIQVDEPKTLVDEKTRNDWEVAKDQLRYQLDAATFNTWLKDVWVIDYADTGEIPGAGVFVLAVRNEYALEMMEGRLRKSVVRLLRDVSGARVDVRFEIVQSPPGSASLTTPVGRPPSGRGE